MATLLAVTCPPVSVRREVDQMWPWSGYGLDNQPVATYQSGGHLHSQASDTPPTITDSRSASSQPASTPNSLQDEAPQMLASSQRIVAPLDSRHQQLSKQTELRRRMDPNHHPANVRLPPGPLSSAQLPDLSSSSASLNKIKTINNKNNNNNNNKPKKRGRKSKTPQPSPPPPPSQEEFDDVGDFDDFDEDFDDIDDEDLPKDPRRRRTLERNRIAAKKCRVRKRDEASALASREQAVEDQNRYLSSCYNSLSTEIYLLKTELLRHTNCNCTLIQEYIANEARRSVVNLNASPSATHSCSHTTPNNLENSTRRTSYFDTEPNGSDDHSPFSNPAGDPSLDGWMPNPPMSSDVAVTTPYQTYEQSAPLPYATPSSQPHDKMHAAMPEHPDSHDGAIYAQELTFGQMVDSVAHYGQHLSPYQQ